MTFFEQSVFFGVSVSLAAYGIGVLLQKKFKFALFNPLLISVVLTIAVLLTAHISYDTFYEGAKYLSYLLTPATVCLAVPLYEKLSLLKSNWKAIFAGILSGVITTLCSVFVMSKLFHLTHEEYVTLLPKSITTAIGMGVSEELGGYVTLTVAMIIITGSFGNVIAVSVCRLFHITDQGREHWLGRARAGHGQGARDRRGRGRDEQPVHRRGGPSHGRRRVDLRKLHVKKGAFERMLLFLRGSPAVRAAAPKNQKNIQDDLSAYCFGDFYTRKFLPIHERELLTFSILASQGGCEGQVKAHVGGNATVGNGKEVLLAALTVCLPYIGFPRTLNALSCINEVLPEAKQ